MQLSAQAISEFQKIYKTVYGSEIATDVAENMGLSFLSVFRLIYRVVPSIEQDKFDMYKTERSVYKYY